MNEDAKRKVRVKAEIRYIKDEYGYAFPIKARYIRNDRRIYTIMDFEHDEEIEFDFMCGKPSSNEEGYAFYRSVKNHASTHIVHITDIKEATHDNQSGL